MQIQIIELKKTLNICHIIKAIEEQDIKISNIVIISQTECLTKLENKINTLESQLNKLTK